MRIIGLLPWYDESASWLGATVASCARLCDHVIAADGAFALFPDAKAASGWEQHEAIVDAAAAAGLGLTLHIPSEPWQDNEIGKRQALFRLGEAIATPWEDWYLLIDADEVIVECPPTAREDLERTDLHVASVSRTERIDWHANEQMEALAAVTGAPSLSKGVGRHLYRAIPGLRVVFNHYTYLAVDRDGREMTLRGLPRLGLEPDLDLRGVVIDHRNKRRDKDRARRAEAYYRVREAVGAEVRVEDIEAASGRGAQRESPAPGSTLATDGA